MASMSFEENVSVARNHSECGTPRLEVYDARLPKFCRHPAFTCRDKIQDAAIDEIKSNHVSTLPNLEDSLVQSTDKAGALQLVQSIDHVDLIKISQALTHGAHEPCEGIVHQKWRLDSLLKGASVYKPPPPPKPEPTREYKILMKHLREEEEKRQYERMLNPLAQSDPLIQAPWKVKSSTGNETSPFHYESAADVDENTFADVNRQMALIINVLVSIIACSVSIWIAARRWEVPQRLGLAMSGSSLVAVAEVVIYMGYIRRIGDAKTKERDKIETKKVLETWILKGNSTSDSSDSLKYRKNRNK